MANVTVTSTTPNVTVDSTNLTVNVAQTSSNIVVSQVASVANANIVTGLLSVTDAGGDGSLAYDGLGVFTYTGPSASEVRAHVSATDAGGDGSLGYNSSTGVFTYTGPGATEVRAHFSNTSPITLSSGVIGIDSTAIFTGKTTDDLPQGNSNVYFSTSGAAVNTTNLTEGTNLYFTTARANSAITTFFGDASNAPFSIGGNLNIAGNLNYENVTDLFVTDQKITLNANAATNANVEIIANRPQNTSVNIRWNETDDKWQFTNDGSTFYNIPASTSDLAEGTNLYYSNTRVTNFLTASNITVAGLNVVSGNSTIANLEFANNAIISSPVSGGQLKFGPANNPAGSGMKFMFDIESGDGDSKSYVSIGNGPDISTASQNPAFLVRGHSSDSNSQGNVEFNVGDSASGPSELRVHANNINDYFLIQGNGGLTANVSSTFKQGVTLESQTAASSSSKLRLIGVNNSNAIGSAANIELLNYSTGHTALEVEGNISALDSTSGGLAHILAQGNITTTHSFVGAGTGITGMTTSQVSEGTNLYYTTARSNTDFDARLATSNTSSLAEGTNLYYTTARANSAIGAYTGTISTGNTISGTTITATTELQTTQVKPNSSDVITLKDTNTLSFNPLLQSVSYNAGRVKQTGTVINRQTAAIASESVTSNFGGRVGSTHIAGLYVGSTSAVVGGAGGSITFTEGSTDVDIRGLQVTTGSNYLGLYGGSKAFADLNSYFRAGQVIGLNRASGDFMGPQQKDTVITEVLNSDGSNGHANVRLSKAAKYSETFTVSTTLTDTIAITDQVSQAGNTNIRAIHGITPTNFVYSTTDIKGMMVQDYQIEGTTENGANYFEFMTDTTLSQVNAEILPNMLSKANVTDYYEIIDMESDKGFYRFPDTVLIGDKSGPESRNNYRDTLTSFGINVQWSGLDDDVRYPANTVQPALVFQNFTDNALQSQSGQEDRAGPRILLSSFSGNKNNPQLSWYPEQNQEVGKYGWWSTSGEDAVPSGTIPPAAITGIAAHDWDTDANVSLDIIQYSSSRTASGTKSNYLAFLDGELELSAHSTKKIKFGESGTMGAGSTIRGDATQTNTYATVDGTETELFNRLQLYSRSTTEINALTSPQAGQMLYNNTLNQVVFYNGSEWRKITDSTM